MVNNPGFIYPAEKIGTPPGRAGGEDMVHFIEMLPIRKIAPQIVSLSTYYGKTFAQTSPKVSNSGVAWLCR